VRLRTSGFSCSARLVEHLASLICLGCAMRLEEQFQTWFEEVTYFRSCNNSSCRPELNCILSKW
jgi:hypothetical protein